MYILVCIFYNILVRSVAEMQPTITVHYKRQLRNTRAGTVAGRTTTETGKPRQQMLTWFSFRTSGPCMHGEAIVLAHQTDRPGREDRSTICFCLIRPTVRMPSIPTIADRWD